MAWTAALRERPYSSGTGRNLGGTLCLSIPTEREQRAVPGCSRPAGAGSPPCQAAFSIHEDE